jgi:hypothetical protein
MKKPVTLIATNGKTVRLRSCLITDSKRGYDVKLCYVPHDILVKLGRDAGFNGPEYWEWAITHTGERLRVQGYRVSADKGRPAGKDYTTLDQMNAELYAAE